MYLFIISMIAILVLFYMYEMNKEKFTIGYDPNFLFQEPVNYNTKKQNCDELTFNPTECIVDTVIPFNKTVCNESLSPITNNDKYNAKTFSEQKENPTLSLIYNFDLLPSFNGAQISELESLTSSKSDVKSLNSIENDIMTNYQI